MKILVFGATGQVAQALEARASSKLQISSIGRSQADLENPESCVRIIRETDADAVINAAAYTAVDQAETEEALAKCINGETPGVMARAAADRHLPFLHISTDYVFDGSGEMSRKPDDVVAPINAYGRSKLAGEEAIRAAKGLHAILRTSWVFSATGNNFVTTMLRLAETRDSLNVVDDQIGGPTPASDIASALILMARKMADGQSGGTYHLSGAPFTSWAGFAKEIFHLAGKDMRITGIPSAEYPTPASRPLNSRLDCSSLKADFGITQPDWRAGLKTVLAELETR